MKLVAFFCLGLASALAFVDECTFSITESIPNHVDLHADLTTANAWLGLIGKANTSIDIASFYWSLTVGGDAFGGEVGKSIFNALKVAGQRGVKIRVVQSEPTPSMEDDDSFALEKLGLIELRNLNMTALFNGGVLHTKFMIIDEETLWVGSANMDWRSLTQVKELGVQVANCGQMAGDLQKVFEIYWEASTMGVLPKTWPKSLSTQFNFANPAALNLNSQPSQVFIASSPDQFCAEGRTSDIAAIVQGINAASSSVSIEVMDYLPATLYYPSKNFYWPLIDDALRAAAFRGVHVRLLIGNWTYSDPAMFPFLQSLQSISKSCAGSLEVRLFNVPQDPAGPVDYGRVNHAKFMTTDQVAYVGTSNWVADYFLDTAGVSFNCHGDACLPPLQSIFDRDWTSKYAVPLPMF